MMQVSELLALKIEITVLKLRALKAETDPLIAEQQALLEQARTEVGASREQIYNVDARRFEPAPEKTP